MAGSKAPERPRHASETGENRAAAGLQWLQCLMGCWPTLPDGVRSSMSLSAEQQAESNQREYDHRIWLQARGELCVRDANASAWFRC